MIQKFSKKLVLSTGLVVAMAAFGASDSFADQARSRSSVSRSSQSRSSSGRSSVSKGSQSRSSSGRTAVSRSDRGSSRGAASTRSGGGRSQRGSHDGHRGHRGHRGRSHYYNYGFGLGYYGGYGGYYGGYGGYFYSPFYYGYPIYYSHHPERYSDFGALDLNVRPKKTEVWIDGQYVGSSGRFDGYPGYLWLGDGRHELILYKQGFETQRREVKVLEGVVLDIHQDMVAGDSVPAEDLTTFSGEEALESEPAREYREPREPREPRQPRVPREQVVDSGRYARPDREDAREEPGRLKLEIAPVDASIYLDGRFLGSGRELVRLHSGLMVSPGEHILEVVRPGFDSEEVSFSVESGEEAAVRVALEEA